MGSLFDGLSSFKKIIGSGTGQKALGVDIGGSSIKVVQLKREKDRAILQTYGEVSLGPYGGLEIGRVVRLPEEKVAEALKDVLKEANVSAKRAAVSVPLKSSFVTVINIPKIPGKDLTEMIQLEARRYIPVPMNEVFMDWWVFPEKEAGLYEREEITAEKAKEKDEKYVKGFNRILLVAIHKDTIEKYRVIISKAGLTLDTLELESFSMLRSCLYRETGPVAVIDFGASATKMEISDMGIMKSAHSINKGSQDLTLALSNSMGINFKRAEDIKREIGLSELPEHREIISIMEPILGYIFSEANTVIRDYQRKYTQTVKRTILTGGGAILKGLIDLAVKSMSMEVNLADPFFKSEYPIFLEKVLKENGPNFAVSFGLAMRELQ